MIELRKTFEKWNGDVVFRQVVKTDKAVVYRCNENWYEVFKYKVHAPDKFRDEDYERYPSSEDFGRWAWNCCDLQVVREVLLKNIGLNESEVEFILEIIEKDRHEHPGITKKMIFQSV